MKDSKCINCKFHKIIPDPDPLDWFCADDEAIVCTKMIHEIDLKSKYGVDRQKFRPIDIGLRSYQTKNVGVPDWCPISTKELRDKKIENILKDVEII